MRYAIVIERGPESYSAYVPDLPGCIATGQTRAELLANMRAALAMHLAGMRDAHLTIPEPTTEVDVIEATAA